MPVTLLQYKPTMDAPDGSLLSAIHAANAEATLYYKELEESCEDEVEVKTADFIPAAATVAELARDPTGWSDYDPRYYLSKDHPAGMQTVFSFLWLFEC